MHIHMQLHMHGYGDGAISTFQFDFVPLRTFQADFVALRTILAGHDIQGVLWPHMGIWHGDRARS